MENILKNFIEAANSLFDDKDAVDTKFKKLDLTNEKDVQEYVNLCNDLKDNQTLRSLWSIIEDKDFDKAIDDLKNIGYEVYAKSQAEKQKSCKDCTCKKVIDKTVEQKEKPVTIKTSVSVNKGEPQLNEIAVALNNKEEGIAIGYLVKKSNMMFTLNKVRFFTGNTCTELEKAEVDEMSFLNSNYKLDIPYPEEIQLYKNLMQPKSKLEQDIDKFIEQEINPLYNNDTPKNIQEGIIAAIQLWENYKK